MAAVTSKLDSSSFDGSRIPPDTMAVADATRARIPVYPAWTAAHAVPMRADREAGTGGFPRIVRSSRARTIRVPGPAGEISLRAIASENPQAVYVHIHGGGWFMGAADHQDHRLEALADDANLACVSIDYRLAPEHRHPAAVEDCLAAAVWLARNAKREWGTARLVIGGDSAGAHLAVLTLLALRDTTDVRVVAAHLVFGFFDLSLTPGARQFGGTRSRPRTADLQGYVDSFVGPDRDRQSPEVSPLYARLADLCPALFVVGTDDALLEDSLFMHMRWLAAGNPSDLQVYPGAPHNFVTMRCEAAEDAHQRATAFIQRQLVD